LFAVRRVTIKADAIGRHPIAVFATLAIRVAFCHHGDLNDLARFQVDLPDISQVEL
jgi:hypothetical protein